MPGQDIQLFRFPQVAHQLPDTFYSHGFLQLLFKKKYHKKQYRVLVSFFQITCTSNIIYNYSKGSNKVLPGHLGQNCNNYSSYTVDNKGSYRFLDPKFKTFSPDSRLSNGWSIQTLKSAGTKLFYDALQTYGGDWKKFYHNKKNATYKALAVALKKNSRLFTNFQTLFLFFRLFPALESCWTNFKTFPRIQDSVRTLDIPARQVLFYSYLLMCKEPCK